MPYCLPVWYLAGGRQLILGLCAFFEIIFIFSAHTKNMLYQRLSLFPALILLSGMLVLVAGCKKKEKTATAAHVMLVHAVSGVDSVDFYVQNQLVEANVPYGGYTEYAYVNKDNGETFRAEVRHAVTDAVLAIIENPSWSNGDKFSVVVCGTQHEVTQGNFADNYSISDAGMAKVRFMNFYKGSPALDVLVDTRIFTKDKVFYGDDFLQSTTGYFDFPAGRFSSIVIRETVTLDTLINTALFLEEGKAYTLFTQGVAGTTDSVALNWVIHNRTR